MIRESLAKLLVPITYFLVLIAFPQSILAVDVTISDTPSSTFDQSFSFNVSISGAQAGTNYLRANLFTPGTTKYFGYTYNGSSFINSSDYSEYLPISIDSSGKWSGSIQAKLDSNSSYYSGAGTYSLKVRRYTESGSSYIWSNEVSINIINSTPSPTPTQTPTALSSPVASSNPTPTPAPTTKPSIFDISNNPSEISSNQSFSLSVKLSLPNNPNTNFYLKGAFKRTGGSNYFGLTKVSGNWIKNGSSYSSQFPITTDSSGNSKDTIELMPDMEDAGFTGSGDYILKVGRYIDSGSGPVWSNEIDIKINQVEGEQINNTENKTITDSQTINPSPSNQTTTIENTQKKSVILAGNKKSNIKIASIAGISTSSATESSSSSAESTESNKKGINYFSILGGILTLTGVTSLGFLLLKTRGLV